MQCKQTTDGIRKTSRNGELAWGLSPMLRKYIAASLLSELERLTELIRDDRTGL